MNTLYTILAIIGGLFLLTATVGALYVNARSSASDAAMTRLRAENEDLVRRLDWIEPRHKQVEEQNALLLQLHNPTAQLDALTRQGRDNHQQIVTILEAQSTLLHQIDEELPHSGQRGGGHP